MSSVQNRKLLPGRSRVPGPLPANGAIPEVTFDYIGQPSGYGVHIEEIFRSGGEDALVYTMQAAREPVLQGIDQNRQQLKLYWPGYEHIGSTRGEAQPKPLVLPATNRTLTRGQLAFNVTRLLCRYLQMLEAEVPHPSMGNFRVGLQHWRMKHVILVSLYHTGGNTWHAELHLEHS